MRAPRDGKRGRYEHDMRVTRLEVDHANCTRAGMMSSKAASKIRLRLVIFPVIPLACLHHFATACSSCVLFSSLYITQLLFPSSALPLHRPCPLSHCLTPAITHWNRRRPTRARRIQTYSIGGGVFICACVLLSTVGSSNSQQPKVRINAGT